MRSRRFTNQKKIILDYLKSTEIHPSAETVYLEVKRKLPQISRGTVYRILNDFKERGEIREIPLGVSHYDGDVSSHAHFICQKCGRISDIFDFCRECRFLKRKLRRKKGKISEINSYQMYFYGLCKKCQKE